MALTEWSCDEELAGLPTAESSLSGNKGVRPEFFRAASGPLGWGHCVARPSRARELCPDVPRITESRPETWKAFPNAGEQFGRLITSVGGLDGLDWPP